MTLSAYTASVLEDRAGLIAEMHAMSERLSRLEAALEDREPSGTDADLRAMVLETLLLVRQRAQPAERRAAEGTVEACGMKVWRPEA